MTNRQPSNAAPRILALPHPCHAGRMVLLVPSEAYDWQRLLIRKAQAHHIGDTRWLCDNTPAQQGLLRRLFGECICLLPIQAAGHRCSDMPKTAIP